MVAVEDFYYLDDAMWKEMSWIKYKPRVNM